MILLLMSLLLGWTPFAQETRDRDIAFDIRARQNLLMGHGMTTGLPYYDVVISRQPTAGVLIKLPYTKKGGKFSFDLHHRLAMTESFGLPADVTTVVEVLSGGGTSMGVYTIADTIKAGQKFDEPIEKTSTAEIDKYVTPLSRKTITMDIKPGPQSLSIVGQMLIISRGAAASRIDTPGTRIAIVSNFKFQDAEQGTPLR
ncbi:MAG TPA: hypothetical protein VKY31_13730 [Terriglobia bacterium]|nr:hypothetical protein [Terriglobia bacterium]